MPVAKKRSTKPPRVAVVMGSDSDWEVMSAATKRLETFGLAYEVTVTSAHRSPERTATYVASAGKRGIAVFIVGAGAAAHLAGTIAAHTTVPVIGVPLASSDLRGLDALLATVQMPAGVPVATMAIGKAGAENAAIVAAQILALNNKALATRLLRFKAELAERVAERDRQLQEKVRL
jgi:5-(carboxyamino)imidazole ribonucleotide mutase